MKIIFYFSIIILIIGCKEEEQKEPILESEVKVTETVKIEENILKNFIYEDVARYAMSSIMQEPVKIIKAIKNNKLYLVAYTRKSDNQKFEYKIKFDGNKILWANIDGRWRNSEYDEKISFKENENSITIIQTFGDNSQDIQEYKKGE